MAVVIVGLLWFFGRTKPNESAHNLHEGHLHESSSKSIEAEVATSSFSIDSALSATKNKLTPQEAASLEKVETSVQKATNNEDKIHAYHQLSQFWKSNVRAFIPYAWYTAEEARLVNSEKNLNFAAHLFLNNLQNVENEELVKWMALQANDLFERSLRINPNNDSSKVGLGATYLFGHISNAPMMGIAKIKEVVDRDSANVFAQMTLATGSLMSGQIDKAKERFEVITRVAPQNVQANLLLADIFEKQENKQEALKYYQRALPLVANHKEMIVELEKRIEALKKHN